MKKIALTRIITLSGFIILISIFLLYRIGRFDAYLVSENKIIQTSPNGGKITLSNTDSLPVKPASKSRTLMSSSKSLVITDNDPFSRAKKKREYLSYMLTYRFTYFQDSLKKSAKPLPPSFQLKLDSFKYTNKRLNWYYPQ